jgi:hypothetical protein
MISTAIYLYYVVVDTHPVVTESSVANFYSRRYHMYFLSNKTLTIINVINTFVRLSYVGRSRRSNLALVSFIREEISRGVDRNVCDLAGWVSWHV